MTWKNTWNPSNQMVTGNDNPQAAETGLKKKRKPHLLVLIQRSLCCCQLHADMSRLGSPGGQDSQRARGSSRAERLTDRPGTPLGKHALRGCCSHAPVRKRPDAAGICEEKGKCLWSATHFAARLSAPPWQGFLHTEPRCPARPTSCRQPWDSLAATTRYWQ